eukprot:6202310-Pleurochrysis_carterae.AAC.2
MQTEVHARLLHELPSTEQRMWPAATSSALINKDCACFTLCTIADVQDFLQRLPYAVNAKSPWHAYLEAVYGPGAPKVVRISVLELFYTHLLPASRCGGGLNQCPHEKCKGWLAPMPNQSLARPVGAVWLNGDALLVQEPRSQRRYVPQHGWAEVTRVFAKREGLGYGCWLWPARGAGIFVNVGRSLTVSSTMEAERVLGHLSCPRGDVSQSSGLDEGGFLGMAVSKLMQFCSKDYIWADRARALRYDSVQITYRNNPNPSGWHWKEVHMLKPWKDPDIAEMSELMLASTACIDRLEQLPDGCLPPGITVKTGWRHNLKNASVCHCASGRGRLNCAGIPRTGDSEQNTQIQPAPNAKRDAASGKHEAQKQNTDEGQGQRQDVANLLLQAQALQAQALQFAASEQEDQRRA